MTGAKNAGAARRGWSAILLAAVPLSVLALLFWPLPDALVRPELAPPSRLLDRNGALLYEVRGAAEGSQTFLPLQEIPADALQALLTTEDRDFYNHPGISLRGIARAMLHNVQALSIVEGGSTVTQQLVRVRLQPRSRGVAYKLFEAYAAMRLERLMSKEKILESYLNSAYFGHQAYGIAAAARTYFGKEPRELSLAENALLIGLLKSPSGYDPFRSMGKAVARRNLVLKSMREHRDIDAEEERTAVAAPVILHPDKTAIRAPHFVQWLLQGRGEPEPGSAVRTTLDVSLQTEAERIVTHQLERLKDRNVTSAAVVVLDAHNGDILTMVGSSDYFDANNDGAVNVAVSPRQPGSALKPFTYALALAQGETAATTVADVETQFLTGDGNPYVPRNYDFGYHGLVSYREALANSYNIAAVKVLERVGVSTLLLFLRACGITTLTQQPDHYGLALTLGDGEVTLLELTQAYGMFARGGRTLSARPMLDDPVDAGREVLDPSVAWLISDILSDDDARLPEFGRDGPLNFDRPVAAKTGTTRNSRDNWTIGYTPGRIVGVWVGNADNTPMKDTSGVTGAGPIFHDVMEAVLRDTPIEPFVPPTNIVEADICRPSGKVPTPACAQIRREYFIRGTQPREPDDLYRILQIDSRTNLLAGPGCPRNVIVERTFAFFPPEVRSWARDNGWPAPPDRVSPLCGGSTATSSVATSGLHIEQPEDGDSFELDPLVPDDAEKIIFRARGPEGVHDAIWSVNDIDVGTARAPDFRFEWTPAPGRSVIGIRAGGLSDRRAITVRRRE